MARSFVLAGFVLAALVGSPRDARAEGPPSQEGSDAPRAADDDRLQRFLDMAASRERGSRVALAVTLATLGAITIPAGVVLTTRADPGLQVAGVTLLVGGGFDVLGFIGALQPAPIEVIREHHDRRKARGEPTDRVVAETEDEWRSQAQPSKGWAVAALVGGGVELAAGLTLLLADPVLDMSRQNQTVVGTLLVGASIPAVTGGLYALLKSPAGDGWWEAYQATATTRTAPARPSVSVVPLRGGAAGVVGVTF